MNVTQILNLAKVYSDKKWQFWSIGDLAKIHQLLTALAKKHAIKYEIEMIADEPALLDEETPSKSKTEMLHDLITEATYEGNFHAVREMLEQMLVMCDELAKDEKKQVELQN